MTIRRLAEALGVTPMALYKHVAGRDDLIDGMVDAIITSIPEPSDLGGDWRGRVRARILAARSVISGHPWAIGAIESRTNASPIALGYMDSLMGMLRAGGFSLDLLHNSMHALSTRMWGFTREVFPTPDAPADPEQRAAMFAVFAEAYPNIVAMASGAAHAGGDCDSDAEFEFALDLMLDGFSAHLAKQRPAPT